jgi:hypothetical protein
MLGSLCLLGDTRVRQGFCAIRIVSPDLGMLSKLLAVTATFVVNIRHGSE